MAKCYVCGKRGFFLRVNEHGRCKTCGEEYRRRESQRKFQALQKNKEFIPDEDPGSAVLNTQKAPVIKKTSPTGHSTYILNNIKNDCDVQLLHFNNSSYLTVYCLYPVIKFKPRARRPYVIVNGSRELPLELEFSPCTKSEGEGLVRFYFDRVSDLSPLEEHLVSRYNRVFKRAQDSLSNGTLADMKNAAKTINSRITI